MYYEGRAGRDEADAAGLICDSVGVGGSSNKDVSGHDNYHYCYYCYCGIYSCYSIDTGGRLSPALSSTHHARLQ